MGGGAAARGCTALGLVRAGDNDRDGHVEGVQRAAVQAGELLAIELDSTSITEPSGPGPASVWR